MNNLSQQPYKGLTPYEERDKDNFFGRAEDIRILVDKIRARKLTFLFAASGVGKSSLLQAGVIPELKQPAHSFYAPLDVIYLRDWVEKPLETFKQKVLDYFQRDGRLTPDAHQQASVVLKDFLNFCTLLSSDPLVIILDQFEEFFYYQRYQEEFQPFIEQLSLAIHDGETPTVFVIAMREDFALELNAFKEYMPTFLIENFYRLEKLTEAQAKEAIEQPVMRKEVAYEPALLTELWKDLSRREQTERMGVEAVSGKEELRVEPPHLQIVCMQLWAHPETERTRVISLAIYVAQGRAEGLLNHYFRKTIQNFSRREKKLASAAFDLLVSRYGTKLARPLAELAATLRVAEAELGAVLKRLDEQRVLRQQDRQGKIWYELYHDVFAKHVYEWNEGYKRQQFIWRSLIRGGVVAVGLVGVVVGYDGWVNYTQVHLRLSPQSGVSDVIEVYQGKLGSFDFFGQQGYVYETDYGRNDIEADKLFNRRPVGEIASLNLEVVEQWPLRERVAGYGELGEFGKAFCLAEATLSQGVDVDLSKKVVADLPDFRMEESFEWLRERYHKESNAVSRAISEGLASTRPPFATLLEAMTDEEGGIRAAVAFILGGTRDKRAIAVLIEWSKNSNSDVRLRVAESLGQLGSVEAVTPLVALLKDSDGGVRLRAAEALDQLGSVEAVTPLVALLKNSESDVRSRAAYALGQLGSSQAVTPLIELLKDSDSDVRSSAAYALGQLGSVEAVTPLIALFKDSNENVRSYAAYALGQLGSVAAVTPLLALLKDSDSDVSSRAAAALGQLGSVEAVTPLVALLKDPDVSSRAAEALGQLGSAEALTPLIALLKDPDVNSSAVEALGQLGSVAAVTPLLALLKDSDSYIRSYAAKALGQLGSVAAVTPLVALLKDSDSDVCRSAAEALWRLGSPQGVKPSNLSQGEPIKIDILQQIKTGQTSSVLPLLTRLYSRLNKDNIHIRRAVVVALGEILSADKKSTLLSTQAEVATPFTGSSTSVTFPVTVKYKPSSEPLPDYKANIQAKLVSIINDSKAVFGLRRDALKAITALGTEEVVQIILNSIAQEQIDDQRNPFVLAVFQALGDNGHPAAVPFLQDQLQNLTKRKQAWRDRRDKKTGITTTTSLACETSQTSPPTAEDSTWQQEIWEFELGYALARLDLKVGIALLKHSLRKVREGAQEGLAKVATGKWVATLIGQREEIKRAGIDSVDETIFVQAAYRAIDKMLRSLEETGTMEDLKVLQGLKEVQDKAVKARVEWTVGVVGDKVEQ